MPTIRRRSDCNTGYIFQYLSLEKPDASQNSRELVQRCKDPSQPQEDGGSSTALRGKQDSPNVCKNIVQFHERYIV